MLLKLSKYTLGGKFDDALKLYQQAKVILKGSWIFILPSGKKLVVLCRSSSSSSEKKYRRTIEQKDGHLNKGLGIYLQDTYCCVTIILLSNESRNK